MPRLVILDENRVEGFVDKLLLSGTTLQVGLAIGIQGNRDAVVGLIPTPQSDENCDAAILEEGQRESEKKRGGSKGNIPSQRLKIDMDWVAEHARQVSKMLVGGIGVMGVYIIATDSVFKNSTAVLWQTAKGVATSCASENSILLLHFSYSPRRVSCRSCSFESNFGSASLHPCEYKLGKVAPMLNSFWCSYNFEIRLPIFAKGFPSLRMVDIFMSAISLEAARLESAIATVDGVLSTQNRHNAMQTKYNVELFLPYDCGGETKDAGEVTGIAVLCGLIQALAYSFSHDHFSSAIAHLKADIVKSLKSRLEILYDKVDLCLENADASDKVPEHADIIKLSMQPLEFREDHSKLGFQCMLPSRVFFPWHGIFICDYMQEGETLQDLNSRCMELLRVDKPLIQSEILELEAMNVVKSQRSFDDVTKIQSCASLPPFFSEQNHKIRNVKVTLNMATICSFVAILLACIIGYFMASPLEHAVHHRA